MKVKPNSEEPIIITMQIIIENKIHVSKPKNHHSEISSLTYILQLFFQLSKLFPPRQIQDQKFKPFLAAIPVTVKILMAPIVMQTFRCVYVSLITQSQTPNNVIKVRNINGI